MCLLSMFVIYFFNEMLRLNTCSLSAFNSMITRSFYFFVLFIFLSILTLWFSLSYFISVFGFHIDSLEKYKKKIMWKMCSLFWMWMNGWARDSFYASLLFLDLYLYTVLQWHFIAISRYTDIGESYRTIKFSPSI